MNECFFIFFFLFYVVLLTHAYEALLIIFILIHIKLDQKKPAAKETKRKRAKMRMKMGGTQQKKSLMGRWQQVHIDIFSTIIIFLFYNICISSQHAYNLDISVPSRAKDNLPSYNTGNYSSSSVMSELFGQRDFSGAILKPDAASRPIFVCPDGRIFYHYNN